jgi:hypothetical protein
MSDSAGGCSDDTIATAGACTAAGTIRRRCGFSTFPQSFLFLIIIIIITSRTRSAGSFCDWDYTVDDILNGLQRDSASCAPAANAPGGWRGTHYCAGPCLPQLSTSCPEVSTFPACVWTYASPPQFSPADECTVNGGLFESFDASSPNAIYSGAQCWFSGVATQDECTNVTFCTNSTDCPPYCYFPQYPNATSCDCTAAPASATNICTDYLPGGTVMANSSWKCQFSEKTSW